MGKSKSHRRAKAQPRAKRQTPQQRAEELLEQGLISPMHAFGHVRGWGNLGHEQRAQLRRIRTERGA